MPTIYEGIDKGSSLSIGQGALYSLVAIILVFAVLLVIIGITSLVFKITGLFDLKKKLDGMKEEKKEEIPQTEEVEIKDDDMMAAVLAATIDYQNETKSDVRVVSVKEIK